MLRRETLDPVNDNRDQMWVLLVGATIVIPLMILQGMWVELAISVPIALVLIVVGFVRRGR